MENQGNSTNSSSSENNIEELKKRAEQGDAEAQYDLALNYEQGCDVDQNNQKAVEWYMKSAGNGCVMAQRRLASCYKAGILGLEQDYEKFMYWSKKAEESILYSEKTVGLYAEEAEKGDVKAQYQLGMCYAEGRGVKEDWQKAIEVFKNIQNELHFTWISDYKKLFVKNALLAEEGDAEAQCQLGYFYSYDSHSYCCENYYGVKQDWQKAIEWYSKAAGQGHAEAQYKLGICYAEGRGVKEDWQKAIEFFKKIQDKLDSLNIYEDDKAFIKNALLAEKGDPEAQYQLGKHCYSNWHFGKAIGWYTKAAEQGHAEAQYALGAFYSKDDDIEQDWQKAIGWYTKAAEQGHAEAQYALGMCYTKGEGVEEDWKKAVEWFKNVQDKLDSLNIDEDKKAFVKNAFLAEKGDAESQYQLGDFYASGSNRHENAYGIKQDWDKAVEWYGKAGEQGHAEAKNGLANARYELGVNSLNGRDSEENWKKAVDCFEKIQNELDSLDIDNDKKVFVKNLLLADQGNIESQYLLGVCFIKGISVKKNTKKAVKWYKKAADHGYAKAQYKLGVLYSSSSSSDIEQNWQTAAYWFKKASDQGYAKAQFQLGMCLAAGKGVTIDWHKAVELFAKAADQGLADAQYRLGMCYMKGTGIDLDREKAQYWLEKAKDKGHSEAKTKLWRYFPNNSCYFNGDNFNNTDEKCQQK